MWRSYNIAPYIDIVLLCPPSTDGEWGHLAFGADPECVGVGVRVSHYSPLYLLNQWVDFDQTFTDILLEGRKEVITLVTLTSFSRSQEHFEIFKFWPIKSLSAPYLLNQMTNSSQTSYIVTLGWFKDLFRFWWPWPNFQGHHTIKTVKFSIVDKNKKSLSAPFLLNQMTDSGQILWKLKWLDFGELAQKHYWDVGDKCLDFGDLNLIFMVTPALWMSNFDQKRLSKSPHYKDCENKPFLHSISWTNWWILTKLP